MITDYEQSVLFDEVRHAGQRKKWDKNDVSAPRGSLEVRLSKKIRHRFILYKNLPKETPKVTNSLT